MDQSQEIAELHSENDKLVSRIRRLEESICELQKNQEILRRDLNEIVSTIPKQQRRQQPPHLAGGLSGGDD